MTGCVGVDCPFTTYSVCVCGQVAAEPGWHSTPMAEDYAAEEFYMPVLEDDALLQFGESVTLRWRWSAVCDVRDGRTQCTAATAAPHATSAIGAFHICIFLLVCAHSRTHLSRCSVYTDFETALGTAGADSASVAVPEGQGACRVPSLPIPHPLPLASLSLPFSQWE